MSLYYLPLKDDFKNLEIESRLNTDESGQIYQKNKNSKRFKVERRLLKNSIKIAYLCSSIDKDDLAIYYLQIYFKYWEPKPNIPILASKSKFIKDIYELISENESNTLDFKFVLQPDLITEFKDSIFILRSYQKFNLTDKLLL